MSASLGRLSLSTRGSSRSENALSSTHDLLAFNRPMFTGVYTALITPFRNGQLDEAAFKRLVELQIKAGVDGIVPVGTTGESPTLDFEEHIRIIELAVYYAHGHAKVMAGTGANSTAEAIHLTKSAEYAGADASLQVCPYYNKPSQEGLYAHFSTIAKSTNLPICLYSIPGRCNVEIDVNTTLRLAGDCPNIVAMKEAGGTPDRVSQLRSALDKKFAILSGDDSMTLPFMSVGAQGVVSVASNVIPRQLVRMVHGYLKGDAKAARKLHQKYYPLFKDLFIETNPVPIKAACAKLGQCREEYRLPLVKMRPDNRRKLHATMKAAGLLK